MKLLTLLSLFLLANYNFAGQEKPLPESFVYLHEYIPGIELEIRYASNHNFLGTPVKGYKKPVAILSKPAAKALGAVQQELINRGYNLKVFDAYRPQEAVNHFISWARDSSDTLVKKEFYPHLKKTELFNRGYIATRSGHSRGSTVDLTIVDTTTGEELDMGGPYDFFGKISHHDSEEINSKQKKNRKFLKTLMIKHGFIPYPEEWWHYTLKNEPYPETYFNFPVK